MRCTAHNQLGDPCKNYAVRGATVCRTHGGAIGQVVMSARYKLMEASLKAAGLMIEFLDDPNVAPAVRLKAAGMIADRVGLGPAHKVDHTVEVKPWEKVFDDVIIDRRRPILDGPDAEDIQARNTAIAKHKRGMPLTPSEARYVEVIDAEIVDPQPEPEPVQESDGGEQDGTDMPEAGAGGSGQGVAAGVDHKGRQVMTNEDGAQFVIGDDGKVVQDVTGNAWDPLGAQREAFARSDGRKGAELDAHLASVSERAALGKQMREAADMIQLYERHKRDAEPGSPHWAVGGEGAAELDRLAAIIRDNGVRIDQLEREAEEREKAREADDPGGVRAQERYDREIAVQRYLDAEEREASADMRRPPEWDRVGPPERGGNGRTPAHIQEWLDQMGGDG